MWVRRFPRDSMGDGSLIAPVHEVRHGLLVRPRRHEQTHAFLTVPGCHRPIGPVSILEECSSLEAGCFLDLLKRLKCVDREERQEADRTYAQSREANESQTFSKDVNFRRDGLHRGGLQRRLDHPGIGLCPNCVLRQTGVQLAKIKRGVKFLFLDVMFDFGDLLSKGLAVLVVLLTRGHTSKRTLKFGVRPLALPAS